MSASTAIALPETFDPAVAALLGQTVRDESGLPRLGINKDFVIEIDGKDYEAPPGTFKTWYEGRQVFAKTVRFRPFIQRYIWRRYDEEEKAYIGNTIFVPDFKTDPLDDMGGVACGKVRGKAAKDKSSLSIAQQAVQKAVSAYRFVYGTVSMDAIDLDKTKVTVTDMPVEMRLRGNNFMPFGEIEEKVSHSRRMLPSVELGLSLKREKNGDTTYYIVQYEYDPTVVRPIREGDVELLKRFVEHVNTWNAGIMEKHKEAQKKRLAASQRVASDEADAELSRDFTDEGTGVDDEIPF